jgi:hypothetical protein
LRGHRTTRDRRLAARQGRDTGRLSRQSRCCRGRRGGQARGDIRPRHGCGLWRRTGAC